jgi:cysteinyl-tRNA synthetase
MGLRLYNTLSRRVEELVPRDPGRLSIYCCGPTVYDVPHVGHARAALASDLVARRARALGLEVTFARNITDVDDKILARSAERGETPPVFADRMALVYQEQMRAVGCLDPEVQPKVSDNIEAVVALIQKLIANGSAYPVDRSDGTRDVYFSVRSFPEYGKLSRRNIDELVAGARVDKDESKRDPLDFALWKGALSSEWGWETPFGRGRPGWHIECSAMSERFLGHGFDVHAGGMDLIFPHHENEIAQSEAACPGAGPFARVWLHNGFVNVDKEKMSKSLGNFVTLGDVLERNDGEAIRWFLLGAHYRVPIQFDTDKRDDGRVVFPGVEEAERRVDYVYSALERLASLASAAAGSPLPKELAAQQKAARAAEKQAEAALDEDLNTPVALAALGELARLGNELCDLAEKRKKDAALQAAAGAFGAELVAAIGRVSGQLGVCQTPPPAYRERTRERRLRVRGITPAQVEERLRRRSDARKEKDFKESDRIRDELAGLGVTVHDSPEGTSWAIAP